MRKSLPPKIAAPISAKAEVEEAENDTPAPKVIAHKVFILAASKVSMDAFPLHELVLLQRKLEIFGGEMTLHLDWDDFNPRERPMSIEQFKEEHARLAERYAFVGNDDKKYDLMNDIYGTLHQGRLLKVIRTLHAAWKEMSKTRKGKLTIEDWTELYALAKPEADMIDAGVFE